MWWVQILLVVSAPELFRWDYSTWCITLQSRGGSLPPTRVPSPPVTRCLELPGRKHPALAHGLVPPACPTHSCDQWQTCFRNRHGLAQPDARPSGSPRTFTRLSWDWTWRRAPSQVAFPTAPLETSLAWKYLKSSVLAFKTKVPSMWSHYGLSGFIYITKESVI